MSLYSGIKFEKGQPDPSLTAPLSTSFATPRTDLNPASPAPSSSTSEPAKPTLAKAPGEWSAALKFAPRIPKAKPAAAPSRPAGFITTTYSAAPTVIETKAELHRSTEPVKVEDEVVLGPDGKPLPRAPAMTLTVPGEKRGTKAKKGAKRDWERERGPGEGKKKKKKKKVPLSLRCKVGIRELTRRPKKKNQPVLSSFDPDEQYDPNRPNDLGEYQAYRKRLREEKRVARLEEKRRRAAGEGSSEDGSSYYTDSEDEVAPRRDGGLFLGSQKAKLIFAAPKLFAPPSMYSAPPAANPSTLFSAPPLPPVSSDTGDDAYARRATMAQPATGDDAYARRAAMAQAATGDDAYARRLALSQGAIISAPSIPPPPASLPPEPPTFPPPLQTIFAAPAPPSFAPPAPPSFAGAPPPTLPSARLPSLALPPRTFAPPPPPLAAPPETVYDIPGFGAHRAPPPPPPNFTPSTAPPPAVTSDRDEFAKMLEERRKAAEAIAAKFRNLPGAGPPVVPAASPAPAMEDESGTFAEKMMRRWGHKEGTGLGARGTGIVHALTAEHVAVPSKNGDPAHTLSKRQLAKQKAAAANVKNRKWTQSATSRGRIVNANEDERQREERGRLGEASRVVCLVGLVEGVDDVDEDLSDEIGEECSKWGIVERVVLHMVEPAPEEPSECLRVFVVFSGLAGAWRATRELDGRFFGGKKIIATYFDEKRFDSGERDGAII